MSSQKKMVFCFAFGLTLLAMTFGCTNSSLSPSSLYPLPGTTPTPVPVASPFIIWQNGTVGCFQGNCLVEQAQVRSGSSDSTTSFQTSGNALELDSNGSNLCDAYLVGNMLTPIDINPYLLGGHLQMDVKLAFPAASYGQIYVQYFNGSTNVYYGLNLSLLNTATFTHVSVPLAFVQPPPGGYTSSYYYSTWAGTVFEIEMACPGSFFPTSGALLYINNVEWTAN